MTVSGSVGTVPTEHGTCTTLAETLRAGRPAATYTSGSSMEPLLYAHKTYVILEPVQGALKPGDLPIYQRPDGIYIIHRLIRQGETWCYTRGDNCLYGETIPKAWILGVVTQIQRNGKIIRVTDRTYRSYVRLWSVLWPLRNLWYRFRLLLRALWQRSMGKRHEKE